MNAYDRDERLDEQLGRRVARAGAGVIATGIFLVGYLVHPVWIFSLSAVSIYLTITAILGRGLIAASKAAQTPPEAVPVPPVARDTGLPAYKKAA